MQCQTNKTKIMAKRYKIWTDSESAIDFPSMEFNDLEDAAMQALESVHKHDGRPYKAIVHIEDNMTGETIETYENSDDVIIL